MRILLIALVLTVAYGCGGGSGPATEENPVTVRPDVGNYSGPPPATADVQSFKLHVWDNLAANNRCGSCHDGDQTPRFVRSDDINLAYEAANAVVDLADPALSVLVTKVRGGHNCWLPEPNACADIIHSYLASWAGDSLGGIAKEVQLVAPPLFEPGASKSFPVDPSAFESTVYPLLSAHCAGCHTDSAAIPQAPYLASADPTTAYEAARSKIDLDNPANSRLVVRLRDEFHNCWSSSCASDGAELEAAIAALAGLIPATAIDPDLLTSMALGLQNGIVSSAGGRHEANLIALWEFKTGAGNLAYDTSGVEPALNLTLSGAYEWVGGWGIAFSDGKAQGSTTASAKLHSLLTATGELSLEAWVAPANVVQEGPARIVSYGGGSATRNFLLGQTQYSYDAQVRADTTDQNGEPRLTTDANDQDLQATLQHVVMTYDPVNGRRLYVNGVFTGDPDPAPGGLLNDWDDTFAFAVGSEVDNQNRWAGTVRLLAVHNRVLSDEQIQQNFAAGVGERYFLLFNVASHVGIDGAYVVFEVSQFDSYSYLFNAPFFVILDPDAVPGSVPIVGLRIGLNGREVTVGQAFQNLDTTVNASDYRAGDGRQALSTLGTIIPLEKGPFEDEFFLTFERLGSATHVVVEPAPTAPPPPAEVPPALRTPAIGIRDFAEVNATLAKITGVPASHAVIAETYQQVHQALPVQTNIGGFISSQQMGITQLAIRYCSVLVDDASLRDEFWGIGGAQWGSSDPAAALAAPGWLLDPIVNRLIHSAVATQPQPSAVRGELASLAAGLASCPGGHCPGRVEEIAKATCAAALGSAAMLIQ